MKERGCLLNLVFILLRIIEKSNGFEMSLLKKYMKSRSSSINKNESMINILVYLDHIGSNRKQL